MPKRKPEIKSSRSALILIISLLFIITAGAGILQAEEPEEEAAEEEPVKVIQAQETAVSEEMFFDGFTEPGKVVEVIPGTGGDVVDIRASAGQEVAEGDLLARLEAEALDLGIRAAEEALEQARLELEMAEAGAREEELKQAEAQYQAARESLEIAEDIHERVEYLYENDVAPRSELDEAEMNLIEARAAYEAAEQDLEMARTGARPEELEIARSAISEAEYELEQARISQDDLEVTAPASGTVGMVPVEEGMTIGEDTPVAVIMDLDELNFVVEASSRRIAEVEVGQSVELTFDSQPDRIYEGNVDRIYPAADEDTGQFEFEITVPNHDRALKAGEYGEARVMIGREERGAEIPASALGDEADPHIYIVENQMLRRVDVSIISEGDDYYTVQGDIGAGDLIVHSADEEHYDGFPAALVEVISW